MLLGASIFAFLMSAIFLSSALLLGLGQVATPVGMLFSALGFTAAATAGAIRSISRRLDQAGIEADPNYPTSSPHKTQKSAEQIAAADRH